MQRATKDDLAMLAYFWNEKGDITRYSAFYDLLPLIERDYPEIWKAWTDYKVAKHILGCVLNTAEVKEFERDQA